MRSARCDRAHPAEWDAVERGLGVVPVVDRDRGPAQASVGVRHRREHMRADRLVGIADRDRNLEVASNSRLHAPAPHIEPLRSAADEERDRLEREFCLARRLGGVGPLGLGCLGGVLGRRGGVELRLRVGLGRRRAASCSSAALVAAFCLRFSRALAWSVLAAASLFSADRESASARALSHSSLRATP